MTSRLTSPGLPVGLAPELVWTGCRGSESGESAGTWRERTSHVMTIMINIENTRGKWENWSWIAEAGVRWRLARRMRGTSVSTMVSGQGASGGNNYLQSCTTVAHHVQH